jgi:PTS system nitrogen regulatory IIA component
MDFEHICQIVDTVIDLPVHSKSALLHDLAHRAALVLKVDDDTVFSALLKREELGSTGVGNGVAIPHVRLEQVKKPFAIMARLKHPIDFDSIDGQPVDLVCLLVHGYPTPRMRWQLARLLRTRVGSRKAFDASRGTE